MHILCKQSTEGREKKKKVLSEYLVWLAGSDTKLQQGSGS